MSWFNLSDNINALALAGAAITVVLTLIAVGIYIRNAKNTKSGGELSGERWDGIGEYKNPLPLGWAISFLVLCIWAIWYMFGNGFGAYALNAYSQIGEYNEEVAAYNAKFSEKWQNLDEATLTNMGESIYLVQCAQCHGLQADGINGKAADLTTWGSEEAAFNSVVNGSRGLGYALGDMAPMLGGLIESEEQVKLGVAYMVKYIAQIQPVSEGDAMTRDAEAEAWLICSSCHGEDGTGMEGSAPNLTNYGKPAFIADVLSRGKPGDIGNMPAFNDGRLTDVQKEAVGTYVASQRR